MSIRQAAKWCGQYGAVILNITDDRPTYHAPGVDDADSALRFRTLCGRRVLMTDTFIRADHAAAFADACQHCLRVHEASAGG